MVVVAAPESAEPSLTAKVARRSPAVGFAQVLLYLAVLRTCW
jgi:hypothetical protein